MAQASPEPVCTIPAADLLRFAAGDSRGAARRRILEHVLAGCARCRQSLDALRELRTDAAAGATPAEPESPSIAHILAGLGERAARIDRERREASAQLDDFARHPTARQWTLVRNSHRFDTWSFCAGLLDFAFEAMYDDPRRSRELAEMAHEIAERLDSGPYGERLVVDLRGRAWGHLGNARRALGDLPAAAEALARARECLEAGTGDPLDEAELLYYEASLLRGERRLDEALRRVRRSIRLYHELGDGHLEGRSRLNEGSILGVRGDTLAALSTVRRALELVDRERDPHLALAARHNLVWLLMESGRHEEALAVLGTFRDEYARLGDLSSRRRLEWLEARLLELAGREEEAAAAFRCVLDGLTAAELPYEAAMASLDFALLEIRRGQVDEVRRLASETLVLFRSLGVAREAIAAWLVFQQAAEAEAVTVALVERLARYYAEARLRPGLPFEG
jgi:tetratricopeptide (TPR) repeat protein